MDKLLYVKTVPFGRGAGGGAITHTIGTISGFEAIQDMDIAVISSTEFDYKPKHMILLPTAYNETGIPFIREYVFYRRFYKKIERILQKENDYSFLYCRHRSFSNISYKLKRKYRIKTILEVNDLMYESVWDLVFYPRLNSSRRILRPFLFCAGKLVQICAKAMEIPVLKYADKIVVISEQTKDTLIRKENIESDKILVVPNGVNPQLFFPGGENTDIIRKKYAIPPESIVIGFAGTFGNWHGIPELTEAVKKIAPNKKVSFLLMGDGLLKKQMQLALREFDNVHFAGKIPYPEMPAHLDACDILVISNSWDPAFNKPFFGSPTKLFEYMSMGKAIVASRLEQINDILTDRETAVMFEPGDVDGMTDAINVLIEDPVLRKNIGKNAREQAIKEHTWKANAEKILEFALQ